MSVLSLALVTSHNAATSYQPACPAVQTKLELGKLTSSVGTSINLASTLHMPHAHLLHDSVQFAQSLVPADRIFISPCVAGVSNDNICWQ